MTQAFSCIVLCFTNVLVSWGKDVSACQPGVLARALCLLQQVSCHLSGSLHYSRRPALSESIEPTRALSRSLTKATAEMLCRKSRCCLLISCNACCPARRKFSPIPIASQSLHIQDIMLMGSGRGIESSFHPLGERKYAIGHHGSSRDTVQDCKLSQCVSRRGNCSALDLLVFLCGSSSSK